METKFRSNPKLTAFYNHLNKLKNGVTFYEIPLPELITEYNLILEEYRYKIKNNYSQQSILSKHR
jgi:hypothetical protein